MIIVAIWSERIKVSPDYFIIHADTPHPTLFSAIVVVHRLAIGIISTQLEAVKHINLVPVLGLDSHLTWNYVVFCQWIPHTFATNIYKYVNVIKPLMANTISILKK